ncbi:fructose-bisphosphate [Colletotrichum plurivorum]|uniref:Fructose-bisphosphate aldolase n=1 Tax=Colletotrichum plurivorum TaxID=2175906 RepID=A0A8H6JSU2_9PEZI|nr:fructose-bisphosphate [Colletotrichum plurivorum]
MTAPETWRDNNRHIQILRKAEEEKYGVIGPSHTTSNTSTFFPWAVTFADGLLVRAAKDAVSRATVPISIHLDHAQSEDVIKRAADSLPFDSIMVDMSHYEKEENLEKTARLVKYCQERGIATEAEPGRIEGAEDGVMDTAGLEASKTTPEEVDEFIATGVDALAPAFGNVHGEYGKQGPQLDFERFEKIKAQINGRVSVALHGTNGFPPDLMRKCVAAGAVKINVNKLVLDDYYTHLRSQVANVPHTTLIEEGTEHVIRQTKEWMEICGSAGRA